MKRLAALLVVCCLLIFAGCSASKSPQEQEAADVKAAREALHNLYATTPGAMELAKNARGILIFPEITKAGLMIGGQYGKGVLFKDDRVAGYYSSTAASYGLQAGVQQFGYAMFFMTEEDMGYLTKSEGWEVGLNPNITVVDKGFAKSLTTTSARKGMYVFFFEQKGLMAGLGIQGTKITKTES